MSVTLNASTLNAANASLDAKVNRAHAVAAALEVIAAKAGGADATGLSREFHNLSAYADQIQEALKVK
jgi:hypothetical protein